jgi:outer membrane protein OmpA-like peptidoglycan-associated protein
VLLRAMAWSGLFALSAAQAQTAGQRIVFVSCPVLRTTELPCWLGQYRGELYFVAPQADLASGIYTPQFHHKMLIEGRVSGGPRLCGGIALTDVHISVLPDVDRSCNVMLPSEGYADPPAERGAGPSGKKGVAPERRPPPGPPPSPPQPPFKAQTFVAPFDADTDRMWTRAQGAIQQAARLANLAKAKTVRVVGHRARIRLSDGTDFVERPGLAARRAQVVARALEVVGLPPETRVAVSWNEKPAPSHGTEADAEARKVTIAVEP